MDDEFAVTVCVFEGDGVSFDVFVLVDFVEESTFFAHVTVYITKDSHQIIQQENICNIQMEDHDERMSFSIIDWLYSD